MKDLLVIATTLIIVLLSVGIAFNILWLEIACVLTLVPVICLGIRCYGRSERHNKSGGNMEKTLVHESGRDTIQ